jgi:hypothetical protein
MLDYLQAELEAIYGVEAPPVRQFLVSRNTVAAMGRTPRAPEELLVVEHQDDELFLGLYLDEAVLAATREADPHDPRPRLIGRRRLDKLACAAEGVSHFVYLTTRAAAGHQVSLLELELQAEVDKFALLLLHLWRRGLKRTCAALRRRLFERVSYHPHLDAESRERYETANRVAAGYARHLEEKYVDGGDADGLLRELRASYRTGGAEKVGRLGRR